MLETVIILRDGQRPSSCQVSPDSISELARQMLSDKSVYGIVFADRLREDGPPPAPRDKGG